MIPEVAGSVKQRPAVGAATLAVIGGGVGT
jgi:hypothetical protein